MNKYNILIRWSELDSQYIGLCPEFPGLSVFADTREQTLKEAELVLASFVEIYKEDKVDLPEPHYL